MTDYQLFLSFPSPNAEGFLSINCVKSDTGRNSFYFRAPVKWNSLDESTRTLGKLETFKTALKRNKTQLRKVTFAKGTINYNNDIDKFVYF